MLNRAQIAALVPHAGAMCLLDEMLEFSAEDILCLSRSHLDPQNPLRRAGRLSMLCGCEYGFQAAALHGALLADGTCQPAGYLAALRVSHMEQGYLDDPGFGTVQVRATLDVAGPEGLVYAFSLLSAAGVLLLQGRGTIRLPTA